MDTQLSTPWLHIPMEIVDRELYPKLLLASEAVKNGWQCVIGTKRAILDAAPQLPPGVMYLKSVIPSELHNMRFFKSCGHRLVSLDEEGLVQSSLETLVANRYCKDTVAETEQFFCWGDIQRKALQDAYQPWANNFTATGSPTADLWNIDAVAIYQEQVDALRNRFGKFIMIPSSFGVPNHFMGPEQFIGIMIRDKMFRDQADYDYFKSYHDYVSLVFHDFVKLMPKLAAEFSDYKIILRPHPSEDHETWRKACAGFDNVKVIFEGPVSPWLIAAEAVLHWGSTTGIEAHLLGKPVIAYTAYPEEEKAFDILPHTVSVMTHTQDDALRALRDILDRPDNWIERYPAVAAGHEALKEWIVNIDGPRAAVNLLRELNAMNMAPQVMKTDFKNKDTAEHPKEIIWHILAILEKIPFIANSYPERIKLGLKSRAYGRHKTKDITAEEVRDALKYLSPTPLRTTQLAKNLFLINAEK